MAARHTNNITAAGLPVQYEHDHDIGKQRPKAGLLRNCLADDLWIPIQAYKAGQQDTDICPFCKESVGTLRHILWRCPVFACARQSDPRLTELVRHTEILLETLAVHGWAPSLRADPTQACWEDGLSKTEKPPLASVGS